MSELVEGANLGQKVWLLRDASKQPAYMKDGPQRFVLFVGASPSLIPGISCSHYSVADQFVNVYDPDNVLIAAVSKDLSVLLINQEILQLYTLDEYIKYKADRMVAAGVAAEVAKDAAIEKYVPEGQRERATVTVTPEDLGIGYRGGITHL